MHENPFSIITKIASSKENLTCRQLAVLSFVYADNIHKSVMEYSERLGINKPAVVRVLDRLEELNFIVRQPDAIDRRRIVVTPTQEGQTYFNYLIADETMTESIQPRS